MDANAPVQFNAIKDDNMNFDPLSPKFLRFNRPVAAETGSLDYPSQRIGSGFVGRYEGHYFFLTSRHCFANNNADAARPAIPLTWDDHRPWPVNEYTLAEAADRYADDNAFGDIALYWLKPDITRDAEFGGHDFLPLKEHPSLNIGHPLYAFGFPDNECSMDLEQSLHRVTVMSVEGHYGGLASEFGLHIFNSSGLLHQDPNGFSGGPITVLDMSLEGRHQLVGMIVQGGQGTGVFRFIGSEMIIALLRDVTPRLGRLPRTRLIP
jgi:hypothetical protein